MWLGSMQHKYYCRETSYRVVKDKIYLAEIKLEMQNSLSLENLVMNFFVFICMIGWRIFVCFLLACQSVSFNSLVWPNVCFCSVLPVCLAVCLAVCISVFGLPVFLLASLLVGRRADKIHNPSISKN